MIGSGARTPRSACCGASTTDGAWACATTRTFVGHADYQRTNTGWQDRLATVSSPKGYLSGWSNPTRQTRRLRFPATIAAGAACRVNDRLTLSMDITRTDWNDFYYVDASGRRFSLVDIRDQDDRFTRCHFDPTTTVRFGTE